jgi:uncharacterized protein YbjT (DUF2867 family)
MTQRASLDSVLEGVYGVFAMATPFQDGVEAEVTQGITLGEAAAAAGVKHYVYSSVGAAERHSGIPHFETKWRIEQQLHSLGLPLTILRPVWFYENFNGFAMQGIDGRYEIQLPLRPATKLQGIAVDDIGALVTLVFGRPEDWIGRELEIAGDELTLAQYAEAIESYSGVPTRYVQVPLRSVRAYSADFALMYDYLEREGYRADLTQMRRLLPDLLTFAEWLDRGGLRRSAQAA